MYSLITFCLLNACRLVMDSFCFFFVDLYLQWVRQEAPDVLCLQETKCAEKALPADITSMPEYPYKYWAGSEDKEGYSGVAMLCKTEPLKVTYGIGECYFRFDLCFPTRWHLLVENKQPKSIPCSRVKRIVSCQICVFVTRHLG